MSESEYDSSDSPTYLGGDLRQEPEEESRNELQEEGNHGDIEQEESADSESEDESEEEERGENVETVSGEDSGQEEGRGENVEAISGEESGEEGDVEEEEERGENVEADSGEGSGEERDVEEEGGGSGSLEAGSGEGEVNKSREAVEEAIGEEFGEDGDLDDEGSGEEMDEFGEEMGGESESSGKEEEGEREAVQETEKGESEGGVGLRGENSDEEAERDENPMTLAPAPSFALTSVEGEGGDSPTAEKRVGSTMSPGESSDEEDNEITDMVALANRQVDKLMRDSEEEGLELPMAGVTGTVEEEPQRKGEKGEEEREGEEQEEREGEEQEEEEAEEKREGEEEEDKEGEQRTGATDDVFELSDDEEMSSILKRKRQIQKEEEEEEVEGTESPAPKRKRVNAGDEGEEEENEGGGDEEEHIAELEEGEGGAGLVVGGEREVRGETGVEEEEGSDDELEDDDKLNTGISDWDLMMARRKEAMARARKRRRRRDGDLTMNDDHIVTMIREMKRAAEEDCQLNLARKAATKKLQMLPTVISHLKKADLQSTFLECGILAALAVWLNPLPDHSLPHLKIREAILDILKSYPVLDSSLLKTSKIGKAVMLLYRHPKETRKNREKAGKLVNEWARPIFGLASDFKSLSREERKELDRRQAAQRRLSSGSEAKKSAQEEEFEPQKPGDKGWIGRARVPMPSTKDYVTRPKWNVEHEFRKRSSKKTLNRYEKQLQKKKQEKQQMRATHAIPISIEGRHMPL